MFVSTIARIHSAFGQAVSTNSVTLRPSMSEAAPSFDHLLGCSCKLELQRITPSGAFLAEPESGPDAPTLLLLGPEIPKDAKPGDLLDVFVYLDSQDRPLATTAVPKLSLGQV